MWELVNEFDYVCGVRGDERSVLVSSFGDLKEESFLLFRERLSSSAEEWKQLKEIREQVFARHMESKNEYMPEIRYIQKVCEYTELLIMYAITEIYEDWYKDWIHGDFQSELKKAMYWASKLRSDGLPRLVHQQATHVQSDGYVEVGGETAVPVGAGQTVPRASSIFLSASRILWRNQPTLWSADQPRAIASPVWLRGRSPAPLTPSDDQSATSTTARSLRSRKTSSIEG
jgi:hypothetical protein